MLFLDNKMGLYLVDRFWIPLSRFMKIFILLWYPKKKAYDRVDWSFLQCGLKAFGFNEKFRLDLSKAYDRVDWAFLQCGLKAFGFNEKFRKLVLRLVSYTTFSVLVNGSLTPFFKASRGLR